MEGARIVNDLSDFVYFDKGQPMWSYYGYKYLGVNPEDGSCHCLRQGQERTIDDKDKVYLGSAIPDFTYGITLNAAYKGFDLTVFGSGSHGGLLSLYGARLTPSANKPSELWTDSWDVKGAGAKYPHPDPIGDTASRNSSMVAQERFLFQDQADPAGLHAAFVLYEEDRHFAPARLCFARQLLLHHALLGYGSGSCQRYVGHRYGQWRLPDPEDPDIRCKPFVLT